ncbi:MAG: hypothetical protein RLN70_04305, partial [Rhodospirillaceae bacterium]
GHYLVVAAPIISNSEGATEDGNSYSAILSAVGMLCARYGHTVALERALELRLSNDERQSQTSKSFENFWLPSAFHHLSNSDFSGLLDRIITHCPAELRQKLRTAFRFIGNTSGKVDPLYRFANAWIALEVITGSSSKAQTALRAVAPKAYADEARRIKDARDDLFHKGVVYHMSYHEEHWIFVALIWHVADYYGMSTTVALEESFFDGFLPGKQMKN